MFSNLLVGRVFTARGERSKTTHNVIRFVQEQILPWGVPRILQGDPDAVFGKEFAAWCFSKGITFRPCTVGHHEGNGRVERVIRTLTEWLAKCTDDMSLHEWVSVVHDCICTYNATVLSGKTISPYFIHTGRTYDGLQRLALEEKISNLLLTQEGLSAAVRDKLVDRLNVRAQQAAQVAANRLRLAMPAFPVGAVVCFWRDVGAHKLRRQWFGPATVVRVEHVNMHTLEYEGKEFTLHRTYVDAYHEPVDPILDQVSTSARVQLSGSYAAWLLRESLFRFEPPAAKNGLARLFKTSKAAGAWLQRSQHAWDKYQQALETCEREGDMHMNEYKHGALDGNKLPAEIIEFCQAHNINPSPLFNAISMGLSDDFRAKKVRQWTHTTVPTITEEDAFLHHT